ncbi:MAG: RNA methyltransferase [Caldilinea sp. CFX5]|nr:RNA methyltransferase [Caldilinea sp. CFX5]
MRITSLQNPRIKEVVKLQQHKYRRQQGKFLIEGYRALQQAVVQGYPLDTLYCCPALFVGNNEEALIQRVATTGAQIIEVAEEPFRKMSVRPRDDGLLAVAPQLQRTLATHQPHRAGFYLIAEAIEKPGNLGTLLRSADGAGANGVIVCDPCTDIWHPDVIQGSVGAFFAIPFFECTTAEAIVWCRRWGVRTLAATPQAARLYTEADMQHSVAIVVGTEQYGLSESWLTAADEQIKLPMFGTANSLNVAVAGTLLLYEVVRQRTG